LIVLWRNAKALARAELPKMSRRDGWGKERGNTYLSKVWSLGVLSGRVKRGSKIRRAVATGSCGVRLGRQAAGDVDHAFP
jgi:hypothetical protein